MDRSSTAQLAAPRDDTDVSDYLELLASIGQDFTMSLDIEETLKVTLQRIMEYIDAEAASLFMLVNNDTEIDSRVCVGASDITGLKLEYGRGIVGQSIAQQESLLVRDARADPRFHGAVDEETGFVTRSILCAPMSIKGLQLGAIEVLNKRGGDGLFNERDRQVLRALAASAAMAIRNATLTRSLVEQQRVQRELELVAELQQHLLPRAQQPSFPVHGLNLPARTVSGDFYDFFPVGEGRICFTLGDVTGKGIQAALLMAKASSLARCLGKSIHRPGELLDLINREVCDSAIRGMFVTMVVGLYEPATGHVILANAGHEPPLLLQPDGGRRSFPAEAPPVGISPELFPDARFPEVETQLGPGSLYVFSDGVTEGRIDGGGPLGADGLEKLLRDLADLPPAERLEVIASKFIQPDVPLHDDLTIMVIEGARTGGGP
jgi:sigma-B regulation protein RsbU (phosphoserine phosphatase)